VKNKKTGAVVTMLCSIACGMVRKAQLPGLEPQAYCPERIEFFSRHPHHAVALVTGGLRL
jgi:hypothetical protein